MREFTTQIVVNEATFAPELQIVLDSVATGVSLDIEPLIDFVAIHGEDAEQAMIDLTMDELKEDANLTDEEYTYYRENFRALMTPAPSPNAL